MHRINFIVGLSNGETITEGKGAYAVTTGELSPYQRLLSYLEQHNLSITSLSLATADGKRWSLPSAGKNPKFKAFADAPKPTGYRFFRKMGGDVMNGQMVNEERYAVAEATFEDGKKLQVWVDETHFTSWSVYLDRG